MKYNGGNVMKKLLFILLFAFLGSTVTVYAAGVQLMQKEELKPLIGSENVVVLDVRTGRDWSSSEFKIQGAVRAPSSKFGEWKDNFAKDKTLVLYCA